MSDDLRDKIIGAIQDSEVGFSMRLIRLVDGVNTYRLTYEDGETLEFVDDDDEGEARDRLYAHIRAKKDRIRCDAILAIFHPEPQTP